MDGRKRTLSKVMIVLEVLYLALMLYLVIDFIVGTFRVRGGISIPIVVNAIVLIVPGFFLIKGYLDYGKGSSGAAGLIGTCAIVSAVLLGLRYVPGISKYYGYSTIPGLVAIRFPLLERTLGYNGTNYAFILSFVVHVVMPFLLLAICQGREYMKTHTAGDIVSVIVRIFATLLAVYLGQLGTNAVIQSRFFDHTWLIVGFLPIPGQIFSIFPMILALAAIIVIWTRPWRQ